MIGCCGQGQALLQRFVQLREPGRQTGRSSSRSPGSDLLNQGTRAAISIVVSRKAAAPMLPIGSSRAAVGSH